MEYFRKFKGKCFFLITDTMVPNGDLGICDHIGAFMYPAYAPSGVLLAISVQPNPDITRYFISILLTVDVPWLACMGRTWGACSELISDQCLLLAIVMLGVTLFV